MKKKIELSERIFIAGASGMAGSAILRGLQKKGYGSPLNNGSILIPNRNELDLRNAYEVEKWFEKSAALRRVGIQRVCLLLVCCLSS